MTDKQPAWAPKPSDSKPKEKSDKDYLVTLLLSIFLGGLGIHRFYVGRTGTGLLMMFALGGFFIWAFIDMITVACGSFTDVEGKGIRSK